MNRFTDIDCSFKKLSPIYAYHIEKLVSLEQALEPIQSQMVNLIEVIKLAKKYCYYPNEHNLSHDESASIFIYTMEWDEINLHHLLNEALTNKDREKIKIWFPYLKLFDTALKKLPTVKETVWRGVCQDIDKNFKRDQLITWWTVNSCSLSVDMIRKFLGNNKESILFKIKTLNGKNVSGYTAYVNEDEIILPIGTQFQVENNESHLVHLIEIDYNNDIHLTTNGEGTLRVGENG